MNLTSREKQELNPRKFVTLSKKWMQTASLINQKKIMKSKHLLFAEKIMEKCAHVNEAFQNSPFLLPPKNYAGESTKNRIIKNPYRLDFFKKRILTQKPKQRYFVESEFAHYPKPHFEIDKKEESLKFGRKEENLETKAKQSSYFFLDSSLKKFLAGILNFRIPSVKIYTNKASDTLSRRFNAEAVTYDDNIFFKTGKYNPRDKKGIALLGHELTHTAQIKAQNQNLTEPTMADYRYEEQKAINNEKRVLNYFSSVESYRENRKLLNQDYSGNSMRVHRFDSKVNRSHESPVNSDIFGDSTNVNKLYHTQAQAPRTALISRDLNSPPEINTNSNSAFQLSDEQFRLTKDEIYRDIMNRIRIEFERGG